MVPLNFPSEALEKVHSVNKMAIDPPAEADVDIDVDMKEVYFLIMHFLSAGPFKRTCREFCNELLEHQLLPRRYHAWYSRGGFHIGDENDDGVSLPLGYPKLVARYPHIKKDHLVKLLKQLILTSTARVHSMTGGGPPNAADVPTLLGSDSFSLLASDRCKQDKETLRLPGYLRWPHIQVDQVRGLNLREIGGFTKHHRAPSVRASCYAIAKPSTLVEKMQIIKKLRGHQNAVYCVTFDRTGRYVVTGSDDRLVKIWAMETAFCLASCRGHEGDITDLAVSSNNTVVASSSNDFIIRVWRIPDGMPISVLKGHTGVVTAIAFSPRPGTAYQLLSSSDDGTCRIWDARYSQQPPRVYIPKPPDAIPGKSGDPSSSTVQQNHQILCCAFNANGTVFVTGSSDTFARVWNACKSSHEEPDQPNHEMDLLSGHENDVNYVQFSGCAVASRSFSSETIKEDNYFKLKNSWFTNNIVTCSRDGSAIIWVPRSQRSHGKVGRWTRAYHLKVPPPPMAPQPPRGGPRQRYQPTPRGVNMIVWSLDNRFVLAAIMDCRICVWNASDGSLVHSLIGHKESTFVLDVHPFNPRIAMSAGYDGKTIIWDIWEGKPVQIYETGHYKLVDGKFSPDGTSLILSDEIGQIFIIATGQGESQKDAKYDQFFLGDYRSLIQDMNGNVMDQETQLPPYRRNIQDLLCDSGMIPYPEPYQSMYQKHRLGALGMEWRPPSVNFSVGPTYNAATGEYQIVPIIDPDRWEPLPEIMDFIELEPENDVQSDDTDSEYNGTDEYSSGEQEILSNGSYDVSDSCADIDVDNLSDTTCLRRSKRKKKISDAEIVTSSGRRIKKIKLDEHDSATVSRSHKAKKSRNGRLSKKKKSSKSTGFRPQRRAARNALSFLSKMTGGSTNGEDEDESESGYSESDSMLNELNSRNTETELSMQNGQLILARESNFFQDISEDVTKTSQFTETQGNPGAKRKLILRLPRRDLNIHITSESRKTECSTQDEAIASIDLAKEEAVNPELTCEPGVSSVLKAEVTGNGDQNEAYDQPDVSAVHNNNTIKWGEVKIRSSKRCKFGESSAGDMLHASNNCISQDLDKSSSQKVPCEYGDSSQQMIHHNGQNGQKEIEHRINMHDGMLEYHQSDECNDDNLSVRQMTTSDNNGHIESKNDKECSQEVGNTSQPICLKLKIKLRGFANEAGSSDKLRYAVLGNFMNSEHAKDFVQHEDGCAIDQQDSHHSDFISGSIITDKNTLLHGSNKLQSDSDKMYSSVYKRSKSNKHRKSPDANVYEHEESTSISNNDSGYQPPDYSSARAGSSRRTVRSTYASTDDGTNRDRTFRVKNSFGSMEASTSGRQSFTDMCNQLAYDQWGSTSKTFGLRSNRNRRENCSFPNTHIMDKKRHQLSRSTSWLMLLKHEESYRYIPQHSDEVMYLRQGHEEYLKSTGQSLESGPWNWINDLKAVELCKVIDLDYSTFTGSGESCCKLTIKFTDHTSSGFGQVFKITLPELIYNPDFLVEQTRFEAAIERNWTHRDKCQVWWSNEGEKGGSWWEGRIVAVRPKSFDFPESPWEKYVIQYKNDGSELSHSPWELHETGNRWGPWVHPHLDHRIQDKLLSAMTRLEQTSVRNQDCYGVLKLNQVSQKPDFINRFPVQFSVEVMKMRLESDYYRNVEAVRHDATVMHRNAESYFAKSTEMTMKIRRLSDWIIRTFSSP